MLLVWNADPAAGQSIKSLIWKYHEIAIPVSIFEFIVVKMLQKDYNAQNFY